MPHIVDVHTHFFEPGLARELGAEDVMTVEPAGENVLATYKGVPAIGYADMWNFEKQLQVNERAGITKRLISSPFELEVFSTETDVPSLEIAKRVNDRIAATVDRAPDRLWGLGAVCAVDSAHIGEAERCLSVLRFKGVMCTTSWDGRFLDGEESYPFWEWAESEGVVVFLHPPRLPIGHAQQMDQYKLEETVGRPFDTAMCVARLILAGVFDRYPGLKILVAHMGGGLMTVAGRLDFAYRLGFVGMPERAIAKCTKLPSQYFRDNLWVDTMGFWAPNVKQIVEVFGVDRVLFGTDYGPVPIDPKEHVDIVNSIGLSDEDNEKIFWKNADSLYGLNLAA